MNKFLVFHKNELFLLDKDEAYKLVGKNKSKPQPKEPVLIDHWGIDSWTGTIVPNNISHWGDNSAHWGYPPIRNSIPVVPNNSYNNLVSKILSQVMPSNSETYICSDRIHAVHRNETTDDITLLTYNQPSNRIYHSIPANYLKIIFTEFINYCSNSEREELINRAKYKLYDIEDNCLISLLNYVSNDTDESMITIDSLDGIYDALRESIHSLERNIGSRCNYILMHPRIHRHFNNYVNNEHLMYIHGNINSNINRFLGVEIISNFKLPENKIYITSNPQELGFISWEKIPAVIYNDSNRESSIIEYFKMAIINDKMFKTIKLTI